MKDIKMQLKSELTATIPEALAQFDQLPDSAYIRLPIIKRLYGVSSATIWRGVKNGTIPKPSKLSERCTAWQVGSVRAALAAKEGV
jgi:predicted DNA-binding transcriptional regulator AlpA